MNHTCAERGLTSGTPIGRPPELVLCWRSSTRAWARIANGDLISPGTRKCQGGLVSRAITSTMPAPLPELQVEVRPLLSVHENEPGAMPTSCGLLDGPPPAPAPTEGAAGAVAGGAAQPG